MRTGIGAVPSPWRGPASRTSWRSVLAIAFGARRVNRACDRPTCGVAKSAGGVYDGRGASHRRPDMRTAFALVLFAFMSAAPAAAQKLDVATIKCEDFVKSPKDTIGNLLMWLSGYYTGEDDDAVIDFDKMATDGQKLGAYCAQNPTISLLTAAEKIMSKD